MVGEGAGQRAHALEQRLEQVHVDHLALAGPQRDHRGEGAGQRGDLVGERDRREQRTAVGLAVERREARHRLGDRGEARPAGVGPVLPEPGDAQDHDVGVAREEHVGTEAEPLEGARAGSSR